MRGRILGITALLMIVATAAWATGRIEGTIENASGKGVGGVTVVVNETGQVALSDNDGSFRFVNVPAGTYTVSFTLGDNADTESGVAVTDGATARVDKSVDWDLSFAETITVFSASRRRERIVEAPAAVTTISEEQIQREASHGQLPKLLEFSPGVEATQSGLYDYNLNTRGFNSSLNRRVVVLVDGRDPSVPFLASQEWATVSQYMNDLQNAEFVRGPSSALYGKNAFNGVLNLVTKSPRYSQGGELRFTAGDLSTIKGDLRWAADLGSDWYVKLTGTYLEGEDFSRDRNVTTEYPGLALERIPRVVTDNEVTFGNLRFDKHLANDDFLTFEGGLAEAQGPALMTGIGRFSLPSVERTWGRFNYTSQHWNFLTYLNDRQGDQQTALQSGGVTYLDSTNYHLELQTNWDFNEGKVRLVAGASHREEEIDTANPQGRQTLVFAPIDSDSQAAYAQVDFDLGESLKLVLAARYDESSLHDSRFSPKGSLVWSLNRNNTLRFSYNEAFQVANYSEFFLYTPVGAFPGSALNQAICVPLGLPSCGLDPVIPVVASGNASLELEEVEAWEVGYSGILGNKAFLTLDYYNSTLNNFITDLLPQTGTALGQLNPNYSNLILPGLPPPLNTAILQAVAGLTGGGQLVTGPDGRQTVVAVSYTNFGEVETQGVDFGLNVFATPEWRFGVSYSWFDFDIQNQVPGDPLVPNAPENQASISLAYVVDNFDVGFGFRWVDDFAWSVGTLFRGTVPSYETADLTANYRFNDNWEIGINVTNVFDEEHFEAFGGDVLGRRTLGHVAYRW